MTFEQLERKAFQYGERNQTAFEQSRRFRFRERTFGTAYDWCDEHATDFLGAIAVERGSAPTELLFSCAAGLGFTLDGS